MQPTLSIVIPTHNRAETLGLCLGSIARQTIVKEIETIVVSDTDDDATRTVVHSFQSRIDVRLIEVQPCHQGVARNHGVAAAKGERVLFIGDDILLDSKACECHGERRRTMTSDSSLVSARDDRAILGFTTWDPAVGITPVMEWLEQSGWQFGYPMIAEYAHRTIPTSLQSRFTYTSHVSLPTATAKEFPFRDDVTMYGWEDIEWGSRLAKAGVPLLYEPDAKALHHHRLTLEDSLKRMETLGRSAVAMDRLVPELHLVPRGLKFWKYKIASMLPVLRGRHSRAFLRGCFAEENTVH